MLNRRDAIGASFGALIAGLTTKFSGVAKAAPTLVPIIRPENLPSGSYYNDDGDFIGYETLAKTRDTIDYVFKVYPKMRQYEEAAKEFYANGGDYEDPNRPRIAPPFYLMKSYRQQDIMTNGQDWLIEEINRDFRLFVEEWDVGPVNKAYPYPRFGGDAIMSIYND